MRFIGITGGVGAGKSVILSHIREHYNAKVLQADRLAEELMQPNTVCHQKLLEAFGDTGVFDEHGVMDRDAMARVIFSDDENRARMNAIVHPAVKEHVMAEVEQERRRGVLDYFFFESALLIDDHYDRVCDELWYIYASEEQRRKRLRENRGYSDEKIDRIFESQLSEKIFRGYAKWVIDNDGTPEQAYAMIHKILD